MPFRVRRTDSVEISRITKLAGPGWKQRIPGTATKEAITSLTEEHAG